MYLSTSFATLALAVGFAAASELPSHVRSQPPTLVERDLPTITSAVADVDTKIKGLTAAFKTFASNNDLVALASASGELATAMKDGTTKVSATTPITLNEAIQLQGSVTSLQGDGDDLIKALNDNKANIEKANLCDVIFQQTNDLGKAGSDLIDAVVSKVPAETQQLAKQLASSFTDTLNKAQQNFAPGTCVNAAGTSTGGTASGNGTSTGSNPATSSPLKSAATTFAAPLGAMLAAVALALSL